MSELSKLPNIGKEIERQLIAVGISQPSELVKMGSKNAWLKIKAIDDSACINRLYALEGAILGMRWHDLPSDLKKDLKDFYNLNK
ncbi:TfoX/Sxy family protein [Anaerorhabdus sp.]|uniref:TfoX C-terminal domain-containing protein n=1 Tax=bioreactor metagenome TaxID=1076179 RepID=A0A645JJI0_9ZZZZ|nr:TfoX/Sxy family protein [Anaerorhabdus sp.]MEA4874772.1 TfoX/Sxy family protein [Anaerorhabdus sp.]